jgi:hypothetical protein
MGSGMLTIVCTWLIARFSHLNAAYVVLIALGMFSIVLFAWDVAVRVKPRKAQPIIHDSTVQQSPVAAEDRPLPKAPNASPKTSTIYGDHSQVFTGPVELVTINPDPTPFKGGEPSAELELSFDPSDSSCKQHEGPEIIPHDLFRVRANNRSSHVAHEVRVVIEETPPALPKLQGTELQVRHNVGVSTKDIGIRGREYYDFLEYNSYDVGTNQPVMLVHHTVGHLDKHIQAVDCQFALRAYSEEARSNIITLRFTLRSQQDYQLESIGKESI